MPCGQKNRTSEISHSQTVTPPLAAMDGTTLRLKTATTKRRTRSQRPSTRRRPGASRAAFVVVVTSVAKFVLPRVRGVGLSMKGKIAGPAKTGLYLGSLMAGGTDKRQATFLLGLGKRGGEFHQQP